MTGGWPARGLIVASGLAMMMLLWRYWSGLCNEACPAWRTSTMILLAGALPLAWVVLLLDRMRPPERRRWSGPKTLIFGVLAAVALAVSLGGASG